MQKHGLVILMFILAVGASLGISFFLWGQPESISSTPEGQSEIEELHIMVDALYDKLEEVADRQARTSVQNEDFEILVTRLNILEDRIGGLSTGKLAGPAPSDSGVAGEVPATTEATVRQVLQNIEEEKRRKEEEDRQRRREERWQETQEWLTNTYNERLALLTKELNLTSSQEVGVRETIEGRKDSVLKIYAHWRLPENERQGNEPPSWDDINKAYDNSMRQVLDTQQYKIYKDKNLDDFNRGRGRGRGRSGR
jgi:hypothetical protein